MGICLLDLKDGVLRIAVGDKFDEAELERVMQALKRGNCVVDKVEMEPWDRGRACPPYARANRNRSERLIRIFATLSRDPDNGTLVEQAVIRHSGRSAAKPYLGYPSYLAGRRCALLGALPRGRRRGL